MPIDTIPILHFFKNIQYNRHLHENSLLRLFVCLWRIERSPRSPRRQRVVQRQVNWTHHSPVLLSPSHMVGHISRTSTFLFPFSFFPPAAVPPPQPHPSLNLRFSHLILVFHHPSSFLSFFSIFDFHIHSSLFITFIVLLLCSSRLSFLRSSLAQRISLQQRR